MKCGGKKTQYKKHSTIWCDNQENKRILDIYIYILLLESDQHWPAGKMIIHYTWISGTQSNTDSKILLAEETDHITCFALLNQVAIFFPAHSPGLLPTMAVPCPCYKRRNPFKEVSAINDLGMLSLPFYGRLSAFVIEFKCCVNYRSAFIGDYRPVSTVRQCPAHTDPGIKCAHANELASGHIS